MIILVTLAIYKSEQPNTAITFIATPSEMRTMLIFLFVFTVYRGKLLHESCLKPKDRLFL